MTIITLVVVFGCGTAMMSFEILGSRVLAPYFGSSVTVWACLIGVFLAALTVGNVLGGRAADWKPVTGLLALIIVAAAITSMLTPVIAEPICTRITERRFGFPVDPLIATAALFFLPTLFLGGVTPFAIRMLLPSVERAGITAGGIYALSTVGNIFGTFLTAFYLIQTFGVTRILFFWSGFLLILGALLAIVPMRRSRAARRATLIAIAVFSSLMTTCPASRAATIYRRDTLYHHILVEDVGGLRLLRFDASLQSSMSLANPLEGALEYTDYFHTAFAFNPNIRSTLFIGLGGGSGPKRFLADYPDMRVDVVEIDPVVVDVAEQFFGVIRDPRLNIVVEDGRMYLNGTSRQYDLIVADAYLSSAYGPYIPFHLATREFFEKSRDRLTVGGVLVYNVIGTLQGPQSTSVRSIYKTMASLFPSLYMFPAETSMNVVIVATKSKVSYTPPQIYDIGNRLFLERRVRLPAFLRRLTRCIAAVPPLADVPVLTDDFAPMERLQAGGIGPQEDAAEEGTHEQDSTPHAAAEKEAE
jgi:spermidine synthase